MIEGTITTRHAMTTAVDITATAVTTGKV
jgi:hypothetical protein